MDFDFFLVFGSFLDLDDSVLGSDEAAFPLGFPFPCPFNFAPALRFSAAASVSPSDSDEPGFSLLEEGSESDDDLS